MSGSHLLDRYVLCRFALSLGISVIALVLITVIIDLTENIDTFIDFRASAEEILLYYVYHTPYWTVLVLPIAALLGTLFGLTSLARRSEITAMKALGISLYRILLPVLACGLAVSVFAFLLTDRIVPAATYRYNQIRDQITAYSRPDGSRQQVLLQDVDEQLVYARSYDAAGQQAINASYEKRVDDRIVVRANADRMLWHGNHWVMLDGMVWRLPGAASSPQPESGTGPGEDASPAGALADRWNGSRLAATTFDSLHLSTLTLLPEDLSRLQKKPEEMSYTELRRYIQRTVANGEDATRHRVDLYLKISFPLTCFIIVVLGAPLGANARRAGMANSFGVGIGVCFVFYSCVKAGQALGWNQVISPWAGAWAANVLFGVLSLVLLWRAHK